jgi:hypothetical protein
MDFVIIAEVIVAECGRCHTEIPLPARGTIPGVWINTETLCPLRPDGTLIEGGEDGTVRAVVCPRCTLLLLLTEPTDDLAQSIRQMFPKARWDKIQTRDAAAMDADGRSDEDGHHDDAGPVEATGQEHSYDGEPPY